MFVSTSKLIRFDTKIIKIFDIQHRRIQKILRNYDSTLICANYMPDHVHLLINLSAQQSLSKGVGIVKQSTSLWLKNEGRCNEFKKWSKEYYGVSLSPDRREVVIGYIMNQEAHHATRSLEEELDGLVHKIGMSRYPDSFYD